jgi:hypothetical protein
MDNYDQHKGDVKDLEMVTQQLMTIRAGVEGLMQHLEMNPTCPHITEAWVQSKMTLASSYVDSVHDYVVHAHGSNDPLKKGGPSVCSACSHNKKGYEEDESEEEEDEDEYGEENGGAPMGFIVAIERGLKKR